ncbi:hypothetical protein [Streptomyces abyssomicinicus]|uniref:hypothetical protein n=1 Tax=Streptomyces abyssomicinicus TaxID=574929 RepID=UPI00124FBE0D|nr:hypothetical protein [Streptomyces abyssomicinicus]
MFYQNFAGQQNVGPNQTQLVNVPSCPAGSQMIDFGGFLGTGDTTSEFRGTNGFTGGGQLEIRNSGSTTVSVTTWTLCGSSTPIAADAEPPLPGPAAEGEAG